MKLSAGKRILMFFHWLFSLLICAAFAAYLIRPDFTLDLYKRVTGGLNVTQIMIIGIAVLAIYTILTVVQAWIIFHRGKRADRGFITVDSSDAGRVRIAISAIEQMVRQSVNAIDGIADMKISIENMDDAIGINIAALIQNGSHVPTITMNMQRAIRQFVEMNCGVAVRAVSISINGVTGDGETGKRRRRMHGSDKPAESAYVPPVMPAEAPAAPPVDNEPEAAVPAYGAAFSAPEPEPERKIELRLDPMPGFEPRDAQDAAAPAEDDFAEPAADVPARETAYEDEYRPWSYEGDEGSAAEDAEAPESLEERE